MAVYSETAANDEIGNVSWTSKQDLQVLHKRSTVHRVMILEVMSKVETGDIVGPNTSHRGAADVARCAKANVYFYDIR